MDGLTTPYEDDSETEFMECSVCEVSLKGLNLFKIHVTTPGHLKKEDAAVAAGHMVRKQIIPKFDDILQYVDYLNLDEPVIGLNFLEEVPCVNAAHASMGPRYTCTLCNTTGYPPEMIHHVIGRRHRQKYIESKRPDLVSWDKHLVMQTGKIIRTRAEIIARQDGSGRPKPMKKMQNVGNRMTRVPPWQMPKVDPLNISGQLQWKQKSQDTDRGGFLPDPVSRTPFVSAEARPMNVAAGGRQTTIPWNQQPAKADGWEKVPLQGKSLDLDYFLNNDVTQKRTVEPYKETQRALDRPAEGYTTYGEQGAKNEFLTEDGRRQFQSPCLDYQHQSPGFQGDDQQWSTDNDRGVRLGTNVPKPPTRNFRLPSDKPIAHFTDYNHGMQPAESFSAGLSQTPQEVSRSMSAIPAPFRRFMKGPAGDEVSGRCKRKSRFSDATPEEVAVANRMFNAGPRDAKLRAPLESGGGTFQQETRRMMQHPDWFSQSQQNSSALLQTPSQRDKTFQEESDFRRAEDYYGGEGNGGGRDWNNTRDGQQVYQHQGRSEPSDLNGNRYKADFGQQQMYTTSLLDERAQCPEQFQGGGQQRLQFSKSFYDSRSPPLDMERPASLHRNPQYSKSLEKFTSTILELLSRNSSYNN
ncbi:uncharacterized protein LOC109531618 isoform X2 [Hippocampus comes]|nr:PREDICTED: uncharacterized protein LOC109531618 isoform X2 [Hippocampus comes]